MNLRERKIGLVGAPRSGNRLIAHMLQRHGLLAEVRHYGSDAPFHSGGYAERVVWPYRRADVWIKSCWKDRAVLPKPQGQRQPTTHGELLAFRRLHDRLTASTIVDHDVPCLPVSYEQIVEDPQFWGRMILSFAAAPEPGPKWKGWGVEVVDGNRKYLDDRDRELVGDPEC